MVRTNYLVTYDISENQIRDRVGRLCKDYSLERIQFSVFFGRLSPDEIRSLYLECKNIIRSSSSNIHFIKICSSCEASHQILLSVAIVEEDQKDNYEIVEDLEIEKWDNNEVIIL